MIEKRILSSLLALYVVLGSWKGYVALFEKGHEEPRQIYPTQITSLPEADHSPYIPSAEIRHQA